jgi:lauroyl/myristoyl acyltransferase
MRSRPHGPSLAHGVAMTATLRDRFTGASRPLPPVPIPKDRGLALDGAFWRRAAYLGASHLPGWLVRWLPIVIGVMIALVCRRSRRTLSRQLARARGPVGPGRDLFDVARTFANFASCLTEELAKGSRNDRTPTVDVDDACVAGLLASSRGAIFATAHTAGWECLGALLARVHDRRVMVVMQRERDPAARELQDRVRMAATTGVEIVHVGDDPLASLPLLRHLRRGGVVALQIDRVPKGMVGRRVRLFEQPGLIPEGVLRLAQLTGAPILPVFSSRTGHRRYAVQICAPVAVGRHADAVELDTAAQSLADALGGFVRRHPAQWFAFGE